MVAYRGRWSVRVIGKDAAWDQRVIISGAVSGGGVIDGIVGNTQIVDGDNWDLTVEHNDGSGWQPNAAVLPDPMSENGAALSQIVRSKDEYRPGDTDPNDLVLRVEKLGPMFEVLVRPYALDAVTLNMMSDGIFVGLSGIQLMGVEIKNTWGRAFYNDTTLDISNLGRATLASFGIIVNDAWHPAMLQATQQTLIGRALALPPLDVGQSFTLYFQVDAAAAHRGKPPVEFVLRRASPVPDPDSQMRHNARMIYIAEAGFNRSTGEAIVRIPEGELTLTLKALSISPTAVRDLCREMTVKGRGTGGGRLADDVQRLLQRVKGDYCDQKILTELLALLCRCLNPSRCDDGHCHGLNRRCLGGVVWLPLEFDYSVRINNGFTGQYGPLAFQDPWWKVVLLIIAVIAWLVGAVESIVADKTGWGNVGDHPRKIGVVGASSLENTDACLIELDGSRPFQQNTVDAITGEPNSSAIVGLDTLINVDPQVATAFIGMHVYKSGSRTGITHGVVTAVNAPTSICRGNYHEDTGACDPTPNHPTQHYTGQILIAKDGDFGEEQFSDHGDSGSVIFSREMGTENQPVALLYGGSDTVTDASPIQNVLDRLNIRLRP